MNETIFNLAGIVSSAMFMLGQLPMLYKAYKTNEMKSYSLTNLIMALVGDLLYWVYLMDVPFGPVWALHIFDTGCSILMLYFYLWHSFGFKVKPLAFLKAHKQ